MTFIEGHGILGKIRFIDGVYPKYDRTYLVVKSTNDYIEVLNVSSIKSKERKLLYSSNYKLNKYNPPFIRPSFVKLDSLTRVYKENFNELMILNSGRMLDKEELELIQRKIINH